MKLQLLALTYIQILLLKNLLNAGGQEVNTVEMIDVSGRVVYSQNNSTADNIRINTSNFASGIYTVRVTTTTGVAQQLVAINNN